MNKYYIAVSNAAVNQVKKAVFAIVITLLTTFSVYSQAPAITYTPLTNTCTTGSRTLTATITDADGVPIAGAGRPVLYWKINSGTYTAVTGTSIGSNQYTFAFGTGATAGNLVSYYIVAQDNLGNTIAKPSAGASGYTSSPPAASTPPTSPDFYVIQTTLAAGTYPVGVGQTYVTITDAVNAYNNSCLSGAIIFVLTDATYNSSEVFPITISNPQASSVNTLTIKPNTAINPTIEGNAPDAIFKFNGADYVTIDGSNSGGTTRNLTIINNSTNLTSSVIWLGSVSATNGATHNTIKNATISGNASTTTYAGIVSSSGIIAGNAAEAANSDNLYQNNMINTSYYGMMVVGPAAGESNNVITQNTIGSTLATKKLGYRGILLSNQTNVLFDKNSVIGVNSSIGMGSDVEPTAGIVVSGVISGGNISSNQINDIKNSSVAGWPAYGISLQSSSAAASIKVHNNMIHSVGGFGNNSTAGNNGIGIALLTGGGYGIFFNSVNLFTNQTLTGGGISSCLYIGPGITGTASVDIRNNIFSDRRTTGTNYAIYCSVPNIIFSNINYNDYYSTTALGYLGSSRATIAAWQTATGIDGNSVAVNPIYVSTTDLHLQLISPLNDQGTPITGITVDIDATTRSTTVPDIGADEITPPACSGNNGGTVTSDFINLCTSGKVSLSSTGFSYGLGIAYQWQSSTDNFVSNIVNIPGETNPTSANPPVITQTTWYRLRVICAAGSPGYSAALMITVYDPHILTTTNGSRCGPGTVNIGATGTATTTIQWYTAPTGGAPIGTGSPFTTPSISATTNYYAESTYLGSSGTVGLANPSAATGVSTQFTSWEVFFNVIQATKLLTIDVYPLVAGENSVIDVYNSSNTIIASVPYTTTVSGGATAQTVTMNVSLPIGNGYYLYATNGLPPSGLTRNLTGASYPYNSSDIVITGNGFMNPNFYMCYYRWRFSNGCSSTPRSPVTATVGTTATLNITATPSAICAGSSSVLNVTSSNTAFTYTWSPPTMTGASQTVSPATTTTYTVNADDGTCTGTGTITVTVNPASTDVVIAPATINKCYGTAATLLTASGGDIAGVEILKQDFNAGTPGTSGNPAGGWTIVNNSTGGTIANAAWTYRPDGYTLPGYTFHSNDNSTFFHTNSDAQGGITSARTRTELKSPSFSLVGYTGASLYFYHCFTAFGAPTDSVTVEYSPNGTAWTKLRSFPFARGGTTNFRKDTISLNAYVGVTVNYIRFRYYGDHAFWYSIDNISIVGENAGSTPITWTPTTGLYTNAAATPPFAYTGGPTNTIYASPTTTTTYTATANPVNACQKTKTIDVIVNRVTATVAASPSTACPSAAVTVSFTLTGTGPWNMTYTDNVSSPVTVNNITVSPYTIVAYPTANTTWNVTALSDASCTALAADYPAMAGTVTISASAVATWQGGVSSDWTDLANWCGGIPTATKNVVIPITPNAPVITGTTAVAKDITIANGAALTINSGGKLSFTGTFINDGALVNNGTIVMNGSSAAQSFPGGTTGVVSAMNNLEVNNANGATINRPIIITGTLTPTAGNITLDNILITLHSDAVGTARVATLGATAGFIYNGAGKFSVERYISSNSKVGWRFLSVPVAGTQTIKEAWQENEQAPTYTATGFGMQIVGPASAGIGFDQNTVTPSLKTYNPATNSWVSVPGTTPTLISRADGYMTFIRGDRGAHVFGDKSDTRLRVAGPIKTGSFGPYSTATAGGFISVGNPYPSAINFASTTRVGLQNTFFLWDPKLGQYGGYQTFTYNSATTNYDPTPGLGSYAGGNRAIESGQAFFVVATLGAAPHSISFSETNKVAGSFQVQRLTNNSKSLSTRLYSANTSDINIIDGTLIEFDPAFTNNVDDLDAPKMTNFGENIALMVQGKLLSVERHSLITDADTVYYQLGQLKQQAYQLEFTPNNLAQPGLTAFLEDAYLHTSTVINLDIISVIDFTVNADPGSWASDRFRIVFRQLGPVPVTFTNVIAYREEKDIRVKWTVENELNIDHYDIERSSEGRSFTKIASQAASGNNGSATQNYTWLDREPFSGDNFYRIKSIGIGNDIKYSEIVKVNISGNASMIAVYPNPVKDGFIGLSFTDQPKGDYEVRLFGENGQVFIRQKISHPGGSQRVKIPVGSSLSKAVYNLEIILPGKKKRNFKVVFE